MKKLLLTLTLITTLLLSSCLKVGDGGSPSGGQSGNGGGGDLPAPEAKGEVLLLADSSCPASVKDKITVALSEVGYTVINDKALQNDCKMQITIGKIEDNAASKRANILLERIETEDYYDSRYLLYSDGEGTLAVAYDVYEENYVGVSSLEEGVDQLVSRIEGGNPFSASRGTLGSGTVNLVKKQEALDAAMLEEQWQEVLAAAGGDENAEIIVSSLKEHYAIYQDSLLSWLADLYDPVSGGFYYSNSGRNTEGYLADIETTSQVLDILRESGLISFAGGDLKAALPEHMRLGIIKFIKSRQDPNGYFYHPQWTRETIDQVHARRARDLSKGISALRSLGALPTYPNPLGSDYDGIDADGNAVLTPSTALSGRLSGGGKVLAVSRVIASAVAVPSHLVDDVAFRKWLSTLDINGDSYTVGNDIAAQTGQIVARDRVLMADRKPYLLSEILVDWLNEHCYAETGHWNAVPDYEGVNGFLKISACYNEIARAGIGVDAALPYLEESLKSMVDAMITEEYARTTCYAYNVWYSVCNIFENARYSDPKHAKELEEETRRMLLTYVTKDVSYLGEMLNALEITTAKTVNFMKEDGSFSFTAESSAANSQGLPVAVPNTDEGDVNATSLSSTGITSRIFVALGLPMPDIFTHSDAMRFFHQIGNLTAIIKDEEVFYDTGEINFEDYGIEEEVPSIQNNSLDTSTLYVDKDPTNENNKVLHLTKHSTGDAKIAQIDFGTTERVNNYNAFVFDADLMFDFANDESFLSNYFYLRLGTVRESFGYYLVFSPSRSGTIRFQDSSNATSGIKSADLIDTGIGQCEWFNLRVEYYIGDSETARIFIYINGGLSYVSDNFYGPKSTDPAGTEYEPLTTFTSARLHTDKNFYGDLYFDNFNLYQAKLTLPSMELGKQEPMPKRVPNGVLTFEDGALGKKPDTIVATQNTELFSTTVVTDPANANNKVLAFSKFNADKTYGASVKFVPHKTASEYNAAVFSADLRIDYCDKPASTLIYTIGNHKQTAFMLMISRLSDGRLNFRAISNGSDGISEYYKSYVKEDEWFNLKLEYYKGNSENLRIKVYINGELFFVTDNFYGPKASDPQGTEYRFVEQFTGATVSTYGDWQGVLYFDNVSYIQTNLTCEDDSLGEHAHACVDIGGDGLCDKCEQEMPHECYSTDGDVFCDKCDSVIDHTHVDGNRDDLCDKCGAALPHVCYDDDGDYHCDGCDGVIPHDCTDADTDFVCDLCGRKIPHLHNDLDGNGACDACGKSYSADDYQGEVSLAPEGWTD